MLKLMLNYRISSLIISVIFICTGIIVNSLQTAEASSEYKPEYQSFSEWCQNQSKLPDETQHTIKVLLEIAETSDCQRADQTLSELTQLDLLQKNITDLSPLSSFNQLVLLNLAGNQITDLRPLANLSNLSMLLLLDNQVSDISPIGSLTGLTSVSLGMNQIETLPSSLPDLKQLRVLNLMDNPLVQKHCPIQPETVCVFSNDGADQFVQADQLYQQGKFQEALAQFQDVLAIYEKTDDLLRKADTLNRIADIHVNLGQYAKALEIYQETLKTRKTLGDLPGIGISLSSQAGISERLGQYQQASEFLEEALDNLKQQENSGIPMDGGVWELPKDEGLLRVRLALVQNQLDESDAALQNAQRAFNRFQLLPEGYNGKRFGEALALDTIGVTYAEMGKYSLALQNLEQALAIAEEQSASAQIGQILNHIGDVQRNLEQTDPALATYQKALNLRRQANDKAGEGITLHNMGYTLLQAERFAEATAVLQRATEIWESLRPGLTDENKVALFETQVETYGYLQAALIAQNQIEEALTVSEQGRARAFVELLASRIDGQSSEQFQAPEPPNIEQIRRIARQQNATLVEYSVVGDQLYIWVIQPDGVIELRTVDLAELDLSLADAAERSRVAAEQGLSRGGQSRGLNNLVRGTRESVEASVSNSGNPSNSNSTSNDSESVKPKRPRNRRLWKTHQLLVEPVADLLPENPEEKVVFIPHGSLFSVPFPALQDEAGNYLIEQHTILTAPAIQVLDLAHQQRQKLGQGNNQDVLVVGNPKMPSLAPELGKPPKPLEPLPGAETEAIAIAKLFKTEPLLGDTATEESVAQAMQSARMIHLATHGLLHELKYLALETPGAMALAPDSSAITPEEVQPGDGLLTSREILNMPLRAELVVLSACNTGLGDITGDGVVGLSRAFISAGVPSVVVSLWPVADDSTSELMQSFYRNLQQNPDKAVALRQAMLETMKTHPQPGDWAAFTLIGEAD
ncbi:MAG: CHAT domain-containing protein [Microcoleaceae cyanobacterium]